MKTALEDRSLVRDSFITILVNDAEKEIINKAARDAGMSLSSYCRTILLQNASK